LCCWKRSKLAKSKNDELNVENVISVYNLDSIALSFLTFYTFSFNWCDEMWKFSVDMMCVFKLIFLEIISAKHYFILDPLRIKKGDAFLKSLTWGDQFRKYVPGFTFPIYFTIRCMYLHFIQQICSAIMFLSLHHTRYNGAKGESPSTQTSFLHCETQFKWECRFLQDCISR